MYSTVISDLEDGSRSLNYLCVGFQNNLQNEFKVWLNPEDLWDGAMNTKWEIKPHPSTDHEEKHGLWSGGLKTSEVDLIFNRNCGNLLLIFFYARENATKIDTTSNNENC